MEMQPEPNHSAGSNTLLLSFLLPLEYLSQQLIWIVSESSPSNIWFQKEQIFIFLKQKNQQKH